MVKTKAIILKSADLSEADRLLTIYSEEFGKIRIIARGSKKLESKLRCHIEPLSYSQLILVEGKNLRIVKNAILVDEFLNIKKDLEKIKTAERIIELIDEAIAGEEKDKNIWNLLLKVFKEIDVGGSTSNMVEDFKREMIKLLGYNPEDIKDLADIY